MLGVRYWDWMCGIGTGCAVLGLDVRDWDWVCEVMEWVNEVG